jgi:hypothetical protein
MSRMMWRKPSDAADVMVIDRGQIQAHGPAHVVLATRREQRAKYYMLTAAGRKQLAEEADKWNRMGEIIGSILRLTPGEGQP